LEPDPLRNPGQSALQILAQPWFVHRRIALLIVLHLIELKWWSLLYASFGFFQISRRRFTFR
jgi:hypothetical protein